MNRPSQRIPGYNVDRIDVAAGLRELEACGYNDPKTKMVIEHALMRWARGEEEAAQKGAIDQSFHGINLTCWIRVVAAARATAEAQQKAADSTDDEPVLKFDGSHHKRSIEIYKFISDLDFKEGGDRFCFKSGGDGDNGEHLMYLLDAFFRAEDKKERRG